MKKIVILVTLFSLSATTFSCAQTKTSQKEKFQATYNTSKALVETQNFKFIGDVVYTNKNREKLDSDSSIIIVGESLVSGKVVSLSVDNKTFLIDGAKKNYKVSFNDEKQHIAIEFSVNEYKVFIDIKPNGNAFLTVSAGLSNSISWTGHLK